MHLRKHFQRISKNQHQKITVKQNENKRKNSEVAKKIRVTRPKNKQTEKNCTAGETRLSCIKFDRKMIPHGKKRS